VSRWDGRKRPEQFFELARNFPDVDFIAVGGSTEAERDSYLRRNYGNIPNLEMTGFIDQFSSEKLTRILEKSWILVNTSPREGLPNAFLEAAAHKCAILSYTDPDGFASRFGHHVPENKLAAGLSGLLTDNRWRKSGEDGHAYVREVFSVEKAGSP
jgi:glycosyltransferase involved in cell wall biosynthesis